MTALGWIVVVVLLLLAGAAATFLGWASCAAAKQADEWMAHLDDEWEVGG